MGKINLFGQLVNSLKKFKQTFSTKNVVYNSFYWNFMALKT